jgi:AraC-like DNA-binding protein
MSNLLTCAPKGCTLANAIAIDTLSTNGLWPKQSVEYWNDVACNTFTPQVVEPLDKPFRAAIHRATVGEMRVALADSTGSVITRSRQHVARSRESYFLLHLQLAGTSVNRQDGREIALARGDFAICDSTRPYQLEFRHDTSILVLRFPQPVFRSVIPCPEAITLLPMSGASGAGRLASRFIEDIWLALQEGLPLEAAGRLCRPVLDVIASAYAGVPAARIEGTSMARALQIQIRGFIEEQLGNQDLNVSSIAAAFGITNRYVHALFKGSADTVSEYIQTRRMERAAKVLADPMSAGVAVGSIASGHGFKSQAHFTRVFRTHYGVAPREFRGSSGNGRSGRV